MPVAQFGPGDPFPHRQVVVLRKRHEHPLLPEDLDIAFRRFGGAGQERRVHAMLAHGGDVVAWNAFHDHA